MGRLKRSGIRRAVPAAHGRQVHLRNVLHNERREISSLRIFTEKDDADGVCIEFKREPFQRGLNRLRNLRAEPVNYVSMKKFREGGRYRPEDLPFIKRNGYRDEREWRILLTSSEPQRALFEIPFKADWVHRIILNPWMTEDQRDAARRALNPLIHKPAYVTATFLTNSAEWKKLGKALVR